MWNVYTPRKSIKILQILIHLSSQMLPKQKKVGLPTEEQGLSAKVINIDSIIPNHFGSNKLVLEGCHIILLGRLVHYHHCCYYHYCHKQMNNNKLFLIYSFVGDSTSYVADTLSIPEYQSQCKCKQHFCWWSGDATSHVIGLGLL